MSAAIEDEIDRELGSVPATLSEEQSNLVQMQQVAQATVAPGLLRLPVSTVTTAANSPQYAIDVAHPILGDLRVHVEKPVHGWTADNDLVRLLDWYGIHDHDPYKLQCERIYLRHVGESAEKPHGWELAEPPDYEPPLRDQFERWREGVDLGFSRFRPGPLFEMWLTLAFGVVWIPFISGVFFDLGIGPVVTTVSMMAWFGMWTVVGMAGGLHE